jgi:hypothetical protein
MTKEYLEKGLSYSDQLLMEKFTEDVSPYFILLFNGTNCYRYQILNFLRILVMQAFIASMQMLENGQIMAILLLQGVYLYYFSITLFKKGDLTSQIFGPGIKDIDPEDVFQNSTKVKFMSSLVG